MANRRSTSARARKTVEPTAEPDPLAPPALVFDGDCSAVLDDAEVSAATGRGLGLLTAVSYRWGCDDAPEPYAKAVWFELPVDRVLLPQPRTFDDYCS